MKHIRELLMNKRELDELNIKHQDLINQLKMDQDFIKNNDIGNQVVLELCEEIFNGRI